MDPFLGRYYVGRRYLRECRLYHVLGTYTPTGNKAHYCCDSLEYSNDNSVSMEHHLIEKKTAGDILMQEITEADYERGIELFYKSLLQIRQYITSLKGIPCDHIQAGKAYRFFDHLYLNVHQNPKGNYFESQYLEIAPSSVTIRGTWISSSLSETNRINYEEITSSDAQKAIKQFELFYATIRNYINSLVKEDPPYGSFVIGKR